MNAPSVTSASNSQNILNNIRKRTVERDLLHAVNVTSVLNNRPILCNIKGHTPERSLFNVGIVLNVLILVVTLTGM